MYNVNCDVAVIGAGPAGLAAAISAKENGAKNVLIIERDASLGGILQQCIHPGFGLSYFDEELTGPEYAGRFIDELKKTDVTVMLNTMVLEVLPNAEIICMNSEQGIIKVKPKSVVLAMGCRERTRGNIQIPGSRPAGVYTAGAAQRLLNRQNELVGRRVVILGSGDIGMIMARRMSLEGAEVVAVVEIMDYLAGLGRNRVQCLDDFGIPLMLSHTVTGIVGQKRIEGVWVSKVDQNRMPINDTKTLIPCDTLLLSVGLIPENELSRGAGIEISSVTGGPIVNQYMQTSVAPIFAAGNVVHVNDLADNVSLESGTAGKYAAKYAAGQILQNGKQVECVVGENLRYICPQIVSVGQQAEEISLYFRVKAPIMGGKITAHSGGKELYSKKVLKANPGEMECVRVNTKDIATDGVTISVV